MERIRQMKEYNEVLRSESGRFLCKDGIVQEFVPEPHNIIPRA